MRPTAHAVIWLTTTLIFSLLPFALLPLVYHAFHNPPEWPSVYDLFGKGEIALIVVAVLGATVAELVQASNASLTLRAVLVAVSSVSGMIAIAIYAIAQYQVLAKEEPDAIVNTFALGILLTTSVLIQCYLIFRRRTRVTM
jgi:hypothetical protein